MKRRRVIPLALMILSVCLVTLSPALAERGSYLGVNGKIAFWAGHPRQIYVMNPDGTDMRKLPPPPPSPAVDNYDPVWSPNGSKIAFSYEPLVNDIWVMNADGSNWIKLTDFGTFGVRDTGDAAWSPDGSKIAFTTYGTTINVMPAVTNATVTELTEGLSPHWSPNGTKILFHNDTGVYVMKADGSDQSLLISGASWPCWSPDGLKIAFSSGKGIWTSDAHGTVLAKLTSNETDIQPNWSPDGTKIVFARGAIDMNDSSIWVMNADGSNPTSLTPEARFPLSDAHHPDWQRPAPTTTTTMTTQTVQSSGIGSAFAVMGIGAAIAAVLVGFVVAQGSGARPEVFTHAGQYYCRKHHVPVLFVQGRLWCPVERRYVRQ